MSSKVKSQVKVKKSKSIHSESEDDSEHELFHYANDRVKLMKQVLRLIKPKQIKAIAPDFMKNLDIEEVNSMLLEELLGISNKRLKHILNGINVDNDSSTDSDGDKEPIDIISLDDISDIEIEDDFGPECNDATKSKGGKSKNSKSKGNKLKSKSKAAEVKLENTGEKEKLMSVLEILELQARARAIRSQLALENTIKTTQPKPVSVESDNDPDDVVVEVLKNEEIVISSSDSENEKGSNDDTQKDKINDNKRLEKSTNITSNSEKESNRVEINDKNSKEESTSNEEGQADKRMEENTCKEKEGQTTKNTDKEEQGQDEKNADENTRKAEIEAEKNIEESQHTVVEKETVPTDVASDHDDAVIINLDEMEIEEIEK